MVLFHHRETAGSSPVAKSGGRVHSSGHDGYQQRWVRELAAPGIFDPYAEMPPPPHVPVLPPHEPDAKPREPDDEPAAALELPGPELQQPPPVPATPKGKKPNRPRRGKPSVEEPLESGPDEDPTPMPPKNKSARSTDQIVLIKRRLASQQRKRDVMYYKKILHHCRRLGLHTGLIPTDKPRSTVQIDNAIWIVQQRLVAKRILRRKHQESYQEQRLRASSS